MAEKHRIVLQGYDRCFPGLFGAPTIVPNEWGLWSHFDSPSEGIRELIIKRGSDKVDKLQISEWAIIYQQRVPRRIGKLTLGHKLEAETLLNSNPNVSQ